MRGRTQKLPKVELTSDQRRELTKLGKKVDILRHKDSGIEVDIRFNTKTGEFGSLVNGAAYTSRDVEELRVKVMKAVVEGLSVEWIPTIHVSAKANDARTRWSDNRERQDAEVSLSLDRFFYAKTDTVSYRRIGWKEGSAKGSAQAKLTHSQDWSPPTIERGWQADLNKQLDERAGFKLPFYEPQREHGWTVDHYLPFTPELWAALEACQQQIRAANVNLNKLLGTKQGTKALVSAGANLPKLLGSG